MKRLIVILLILCAMSLCLFGQGTSVHPYTTPLWRTFLDGTTAEFQADSDSTTFFQIKDAAGNIVGNVDTSNIRFGIGTTSPRKDIEIRNSDGTPGIYLSNPNVAHGVTNVLPTDVSGSLTGRNNDGGLVFRGATEDGTTAGFEFDAVIGNGSSTIGAIEFRASKGGGVGRSQLGAGEIMVAFKDASEDIRLVLMGDGNVGIGESAPETLIELTHATPYLTLHNSTHEDSDGGGESRIIHKREDGAGTETAGFQFEASHDGAVANDQLVKGVWSLNTGAGLVEFMRADSSANVGVGVSASMDSLFEVDGPQGLAIETVTGNTTLDNTHSTLIVNASGNVTVTLPTAASSFNNTDGIGRIYRVKKVDADADTVTIDGNGAETIDGAATAVLTAQYEAITIQSTGTQWFIL